MEEEKSYFKTHFSVFSLSVFRQRFFFGNDPLGDPPTQPNWKIPILFVFKFLNPSLTDRLIKKYE